MPEQFMISPAGYIAAISHGSAGPTLDVFRPLAGGTFFTTAGGELPVTGLSGRQGTIEASVLVGAAGAPRLVLALVDKWPTPTKYIAIFLDASNRPLAQLSVDGLGTILAQSVPAGAALTSGTPIGLRLAYDAVSPQLTFQVDDVTQGVWAVDLVAPWIPFTPKFLLAGSGLGTAFNGTIKHIQVSNIAEISLRVAPGTAEESAGSVVQANSMMAGSIAATWSVGADVQTDTSMAGSLTSAWSVGAGLSSDSGIAADLEVITP